MSSRVIFASVPIVVLLALPVACGGDEDAATTGPDVDEPRPVEVRQRDDGSDDDASGENDPGDGDDRAEQVPARSSAMPGAAGTPSEPAVPSAAASSGSSPSAPAQTFSACTRRETGYSSNDCETIFVTMTQASPARCVQLSIDNCGSYSRQGLGVDVPTPWRLASGSIGSNADACDPGVFYPGNDVVADASGTISWNESTPLPSQLVLELTLERSTLADDPSSVDVVTSEPIEPSPCIED